MNRKLNIGGAINPIPGYEIADRQIGIEAYPLPYDDNTFEEVRASHILEHFPRSELKRVVCEWARVLRPGGVLKIAVPDFQWLLEHLDDPLFEAYLFGGQTDENDFHKCIFTEHRLARLLHDAGLTRIERWQGNASDCSGYALSLNLMAVKAKVRSPRVAVIVGQNMPDSASDFIVSDHDRTIIIEPMPEAAQANRERYADKPVEVWQVACAESDCPSMPFNCYNVHGKSSSLGRMTQQAKEAYAGYDLERTALISVPTIHLGNALFEMGVRSITTLVIDAQGMDLTILKTVSEYIEAGIGFIQCESDGVGFRHYDGLPSNSEVEIRDFMGTYPKYKCEVVPDRNAANPDLQWTLTEV